MQKVSVSVLLVFLLSTSCSDRQLYEGIQNTRKSHCYELPSNQRDQCMQELRTVDYEEYKRELEKIHNAY